MNGTKNTNMQSNDASAISFMVLIAERTHKDHLLAALSEHGAHIVNTLYGRGSGNAGYFMSMFGFLTEEAKVVITCLVNNACLTEILAMLTEKFEFDKPNTGIAFTVPVDSLSY